MRNAVLGFFISSDRTPIVDGLIFRRFRDLRVFFHWPICRYTLTQSG